MTIFPMLPSLNKSPKRESNPVPSPVYMYLTGSAFLDNLTPQIKQSFKLTSESKSRDHVSNS